ncbi:MAG: glycosyltransferase family 2 protein [Candidatus Levybacteria bacterium]|nr:glycosyltransferase family 2 protein [Candidatus Levybacteria bacterium]
MVSIIVPAYNEEESLQAFYDETIKYLPHLDKAYEIVFIDDGSNDNTLLVMKALAKKDKHIKVYSFKGNRQKADALMLGFAKAQGDLIFTMDADLQDKPSELHKFITYQKESGADVVVGWRKERKDKSKMVIISKFFNWLNHMLFKLQLHDIDCGFKLFTKDAAKSIHIYGGLYRFIPLLLQQQGYLVQEVVVEHDTRKFGYSKYGFSKVFRNLPDLFTIIFLLKFGKRPLHFFGFIGGLMLIVGAAIFAYLTIIWFGGQSIGDRPLLQFSILLMLGGLQTFFTGFIADLFINLNFKSKSQTENASHFPLKYSSDK